MATIRNTIRTDFVESGADRVTDATDTLGRSQTRLGQASAGAGRSFAAQSQGLGGLVGAYAGAAATVFALQAAFDALSKAAQAENIVRGTSALASEIGQSGPKILQSIKDITQGQLTLEEASNSANLALSSGFNTKQIEDLSKVALGASRALGRNLTDAMTRVVRGAAKMEPELLDELGIFTRIEPAVDAYARKMNIAASTMTDFERRQAFLNAVIEEGTRKFANIDVNGQSAQKSLEQLSVKVVELGTQFGQLINEFLLPVVNFFKNDFGNTMLLFLGVLTLVFSKAGAIVGGFATNGIASLAAFTTRMSDAAANMGTLDLSGVETSAQTARDHAYNTNDGQQRQGSFNPRIAGETAENTAELSRAVAAQSDGTLTSTRALRANNAVLERNRDLLAENAPRRRYLTRLMEINTEAINSSNRASRGLARTTELLQTGVRGLGVAFNILGKAVNAIFGIIAVAQLVGTIFDVDILGAVLDRFSAITAATKRLDDGFAALISTTSASGAGIAEQFKSIGSDTEAIEGIKARVIELRDAVKDEAVIFKTRNDMVDASFEKFDELNTRAGFLKNFMAFRKEGITGQIDVDQEAIDTAAGTTINSAEGPKMGGSEALTGEIERANELIFEQNKLMLVNGQFTKFNLLDSERQNKLLEMQAELSDKIMNIERFRINIKASAGGTQKTEATNAEKQLFIQNKITETIKEINRLYEENPGSKALQTARENLIIEKKFQDLLVKRMESYPALAAGLSQATGKSIEDIGASISKVFDGKDIDLFGEKLVKIGGKFDYAIQSKEVKDLAEAFVIADSTLSDLTDGFENGATTSSAMSKGIFGIKSQLEAIKDQGKENTPLFQRLEKELKQLEAYNDELKRSEALGKAIDKAFGSQIKAADNAISSGDISQYGTLAADDETRLINQRELLTLASQEAAIAQQAFKTRKDQVKALNDQGDGLKGIRAEQLKMHEDNEDKVAQGRKAQKAAKGVALEMSKNLTTQIEAESKKEQKLKDQLKILNHEMMIKGLIVAETIKEIEVREAAAGREQMIKMTEKRLELLKAVNNIQQQQFEQEAAMTAENNKRLNIQREIVIAQRQGAAAAVLAAKESAVGIQGGLLETDAAQGANTQLEQRKALISMEKDLAVSSLQEEKNILNEQAEFENTKINIERQIIKDRQDQIDKEISQLEAQNQLEIGIQAAKTRQSVQAIKDQKDNLKRDADLNKIKLDKDRINIAAQRAIRVIDQTILVRQMKLAQVNEAFVYEFSTAINKLAEVVDIIKDTSTAPIPALDLSTKLIADLNTLADTQGAVFLKQGDILRQQERQINLNAEGIDKILEAELGLADTKIANIEALGAKELELLQTKQAGSLQELKAEKSLLGNQLETLNLVSSAEAQALTTRLAAVDEKIKSEEMVALVANQTAEKNLRQANEEKRLNDELSTRKLEALENEKNALGDQARITQMMQDIARDNLKVLAMEKMSRDEALKVSAHALAMEKLTLDIANNLTDQLINEKKVRQEILAIENQLLTAQAEGAAIAAKAGAARSATEDQIKVQNFIADNRISGAAAAAIESSLKLKSLEQERQVIQSKIEESKRTAKVASEAAVAALSIEQEISDLAVKRLTEEKDFVMSALELEVKKLDNSRIELAAATETNKKQIEILELQKTTAATAARLAAENRQNEYKLLQAKNAFLISEIAASKADIAARKDLALQKDPGMDTTNIDALLASTELTTELKAQNTALATQENLVIEIGNAQIAATKQQFDDRIELLGLENALNDARIANIDSEIARQGALTVLQLSAIQDKIDAERSNFALAEQRANAQAALEGQLNANKLADLEAQKEALIDQANIHNAQLLNSIKAENFAIQDTIKGLERELELLEAQAGIQQKQQELTEREADQANIRFAREESLRQSEQQLTLDRLRSDNEFRVSQALIEQLDIKKQIANVDAQIEKSTRETAKINASTERASFEASEQIRVQKLITDNRIAGNAAAILQNQLVTDNINNQKKLLDDQVTETERLLSDELAAAQESENIRLRGVALEVERLEAEKTFLVREQNFEKIKLQNAVKDLDFKIEANTLRKEIIELEKNAALETLRINTQQKLDQIDILKARNETVIKEINLVERQAALEIARRRTHEMVTGTPAQLGGLSDLVDQSQVTGGLETQNDLLDDQKQLITDIADVEKNKINDTANGQQTLLDKANQLLELEKQSIATRLQENATINTEKLTAINDQIRILKEASELEGELVQRNQNLVKAGAAEKLADLEKQKKALLDQVNITNAQLINSIKAENFAIEDTIKGLTAQKVALEAQVDLQKAKLDLSVKEAELALQAGARQQVIKAQEHILELAKMQNAEAEKAAAHTQRMLEQANALSELEQQIANVKRETASIMEETARNSANVDKQIELQNFIQENQLKGTAAAIAQYDLKRETNMQEQTLLDRQIEESQRLATQEQDNIRAADRLRIRKQEADIAALETSKTIVRQEAALEIQKLLNQLRALEDAKTLNDERKKILELEAKVAKDGITAAAEKTKLDLEVLKETNNTVIAQIEGAKQRARIEAAVLKAGNPMADISLIDAQITGATEIVKQLNTQNGLLDDQITKVDKITALEIKKIDDNLKTQLKLIDLDNKRISQEQDGIATSIEQTQELRDLKIASIDAEISRIKEAGELEGQITLSNIRLSQAEADSKIATLEQQKQALIDQARLSGVELVNAVRDEIVAQKDKTRELDKQIELLKAQAKVNAMVRASELKAVQTQNSQNTVKRDLTFQKASLTLARQKADINAKDRATALDMFKMNQKIAQQQSDLSMAAASTSAAGAQAGIQANAAKETAALQNKLDRSILNQRDTVMLQVKLAEVNLKAALASAGVKANLAKKERDAAMEALDRREALLTEELKAQGAALQEERDLFIEQMKIVEQEEALVREKMKQDILQMSRDKQNLTALEQLALKKNDADTKQRQFELELLKKQYVLLKDQRTSKMALLAEEARITGAEMPTQTETDRKLDQGIRDMIKQLDINIGKEGQVGSLKGDDIKADFASQRAIMGERQKDLLSEYNSVLDLQRLKQDGRNLELAEFDKLAVKQVETYLKNLESLGLEREMVEQNFVAKMQAAGMEAQAAKDLFAITKERLEYQLTAEAKLKDMVEALITNINDGLGNAINKVFDNIAEGKSIKDGLGDIFADTFENIRKTVLQKTLIEPAKDAFRGLVGNLIPGLGLNEEKGADNAKVIDGALLTTSGSAGGPSPAEKMKEDVEKKGMGFFDGFKEKAMNVFGSMKEGIGNFGSTALDTFKGLGGSLGNIFSSVTSGLGSLFGGGGAAGGGGFMSSIMGMFGGGGGAAGGGGGFMSSIMGMFGGGAPMATGGLVGVRHMAQGGQVNALRDRVPAMLEPGEFVMRKPAVKSIGAGNLGQMNATGAGGMGNVQFNIVNEGSPKQAEQQGQPRLDADKIVVDVVMRDLASNGPIRQAMRNG